MVDLIYTDVGIDRFSSLLEKKVTKLIGGFTSEDVVDDVLAVINNHETITKNNLFKECDKSESTVNHAINTLLSRELIIKYKAMNTPGRPVTYKINKD
jgi:predicted transcriptional regulator